jgi:hypothetical protein
VVKFATEKGWKQEMRRADSKDSQRIYDLHKLVSELMNDKNRLWAGYGGRHELTAVRTKNGGIQINLK